VKSYFYEETLNKKLDLFGDFRLKERKKLHVWLWSSITILILLVVVVSIISAVLYAWHGSVKRDRERLKSKVVFMHESSVGRPKGQEKILTFLQEISKKIPSKTWLESIECSSGRCSLRGRTFDAREAGLFSRRCGGVLKGCSWKNDFYEFTLDVA
jgi:hypothetical protein